MIKDEAVIKAAREFCKVDNLNDLELYEAFAPEDLQSLYDLVRTTIIDYSIALTVFSVEQMYLPLPIAIIKIGDDFNGQNRMLYITI